MKLETFFNKFDELADTPNAVPRMRRFILDLAVRGKLVAQDPKDEPADEFLKRVQAEKLRLIKTGEIKKQEQLPPVADDAIPFSLPAGWAASQLGDVAVCLDYMREPINGTERDLRIAGKAQSELFPYYGATQQQGWIDDFIFDAELVLLGEDGVPFFDDLRTKAYLISGKTWVNNHAHVFRGIFVSNPFVMHWLNTFDYTGRVAGSTRSKLNQANAVDIPIAVAPLAEQKRIVAKVDELMAVCDRLEAQQQERETRHAALARGSLARFADAPTPVNLNFIFHTSYDITPPDLRKSILTLAVQGKLVPQDPNDEPALVLLDQIAAHRAALAKAGKLRGSTTVKPMADDEGEFELPSNWCWVLFGEIMVNRDGERIPVSKEERATKAKTYDYYGASGVIDKIDGYLFDKPLLLIGEDGANLINRSTPIAYIARGKYWVNNHAHVLDGISEDFLQFIELHINAINLEKYVTGSAQPKMNQAKMNSIPIALPPLAEQRRIVAKVEQLMALVNELETQLAASRAIGSKLLEAVVAELAEAA